MKCPECRGKTWIVDSRERDQTPRGLAKLLTDAIPLPWVNALKETCLQAGATYRRHVCAKGHRFSTVEIMIPQVNPSRKRKKRAKS